ncbi:MAG: glycine cleavage system protein H [Planctomycetota bacterium]
MTGSGNRDSDRGFEVPEDRHYDGAQHLWALRSETSGRVRIGIDAIGLDSLGELAYVALREPGVRLARGESIGTLEAAKMTSNIVSPVSGTLVSRNEAVLEDPLLVNRAPYEAGWLVEMDPESWLEESERLVSGDAIASWVDAEVARFEREQRTD